MPFEDTLQRGKPIVFLYGKRPFSGGVCEGVERALATMKAGRVGQAWAGLSEERGCSCSAGGGWAVPQRCSAAETDRHTAHSNAPPRTGGRRRVVVPPVLGFGDRGTVLRPTEHVPGKQGAVPPGATLEYDLTLRTVSIPPS